MDRAAHAWRARTDGKPNGPGSRSLFETRRRPPGSCWDGNEGWVARGRQSPSGPNDPSHGKSAPGCRTHAVGHRTLRTTAPSTTGAPVQGVRLSSLCQRWTDPKTAWIPGRQHHCFRNGLWQGLLHDHLAVKPHPEPLPVPGSRRCRTNLQRDTVWQTDRAQSGLRPSPVNRMSRSLRWRLAAPIPGTGLHPRR